MSNTYTEDDLKFLTPDEIAALDGDDGDSEEFTQDSADDADNGANASDSKDDAANKVDDAGATDDKGDAAKDVTTGDLAKAERVDQAEADSGAVTEQPEVTKPLYKSDATVADSQAKRAELATEKATALAKLLEGEITAAEYSVIDSRVQGEFSKLDREETMALTKAEVSAEMTQQQLMRAWESEVSALTKQAKVEGIDYTDPTLTKEFDTLVRVFGQEAIANGMSDDNLAASKWALAQAHSTMKSRHNIKQATQASATQAEPVAKTEPRHGVKTLGTLPLADAQKVDNNPVAQLGVLQGEDLERALARISPDELERILATT